MSNKMLTWIIRNGEGKVAARMLRNAPRKRKGFPKKKTVDNIMDELKTAGFIQVLTSNWNETAGRPVSEIIMVQLKLLGQFVQDAVTVA